MSLEWILFAPLIKIIGRSLESHTVAAIIVPLEWILFALIKIIGRSVGGEGAKTFWRDISHWFGWGLLCSTCCLFSTDPADSATSFQVFVTVFPPLFFVGGYFGMYASGILSRTLRLDEYYPSYSKSAPLQIAHLSDLHLPPGARSKEILTRIGSVKPRRNRSIGH